MVSPAVDNEKFAPAVKLDRRRPDHNPQSIHNLNNDLAGARNAQYNQHAPPTSMPVQRSYERYSSDSSDTTDSNGSQQMALISTQDLMDMDRQDAENITARVGALHISPALHPVPSNYGVSPGTSPGARYLSSPSLQGQHLSSSPAKQSLGTSPRFVPPLSTYEASPTSSYNMTPPPAYSTTHPPGIAPIAVPSSAPPLAAGFPPPPTGSAARRCRLAPDSKGAEIPLEAKWTRIKRALVSPEVLERAGLRYEARPDFVAVLGELSRDEIAHLAKKSAEVRATRGRGYSDASRTTRPATAYYPEVKRGGNANVNKSSRHSDDTDEEESTSSYDIWDDDSNSDSSDSGASPVPRTRERRSSSSATEKYIPRDIRRQQRQQRRDSATVIQEEPDLEDADDDSKRGSRNRTYPVIVQPPAEKGSPSATVLPKPILKNKNENHVRFDEDGPREMSASDIDRERERRERRERRRKERDAEERRRRDKDRGDRADRADRGDRDRDRERERDRDRDRERERDRDRDRHRDRDRERDRDRDHHTSSHHTRHRERDRDEARDRRRARKSVWGETLGAVGIGGAAASLLSVLTEAASGF